MENKILNFLINDNDVFTKYFTSFKSDLFTVEINSRIFKLIHKYFHDHMKIPTIAELEFMVQAGSVNGYDKTRDDVLQQLMVLSKHDNSSEFGSSFKNKAVEQWIKTRTVKNILMNSSDIFNGDEPDLNAIYSRVKEAVTLEFNTKKPLDFADIGSKLKAYKDSSPAKYRFNIEELNKITSGGFEAGTTNIFLAGTGVGKSRLMSSLACDFARNGHKTMYFTMEMNDINVMKRFDTNLLELDMSKHAEFANDKHKYAKQHAEKINWNKFANLSVIKLNVGSTMADIELAYEENSMPKKLTPLSDPELGEPILKDDGKPPVIVFIDYIGNMEPIHKSSRSGMYEDGKAISKEMTRFAEERKLMVVSAQQINGAGMDAAKITLAHAAESKSISHIASFTMGISSCDDDIDAQNYNVLKNRYSGWVNYDFKLSMNRPQFRVFDYAGKDPVTKINGKTPSVGSNYQKTIIKTPEQQEVLDQIKYGSGKAPQMVNSVVLPEETPTDEKITDLFSDKTNDRN